MGNYVNITPKFSNNTFRGGGNTIHLKVYKGKSLKISMVKGLLRIIQGIFGKQNIGPVPITVFVNPNISNEDVEHLREELQKRGIYPQGYSEIPLINWRVLSCWTPKRVYEEVFNARVTTYRSFSDRFNRLEYKDLKTPEVPEELKRMIESVSVTTRVYAAK